MGLDSRLVRRFKRLTQYDLEKYMYLCEHFFNIHHKEIVQYVEGNGKSLPVVSLRLMRQLLLESYTVEAYISRNTGKFNTTEWWDLLLVIEDIRTKLERVNNTPKWVRASIVLSTLSSQPKSEFILKKNQTIEGLLRETLGSKDENQDWYSVAISNDLREESYTMSGGTSFSVETYSDTSDIESIVDTIDSQTVKGKDIYRKLTWEDNDLKTVSGDECFLQSCKILVELTKTDTPEFVSQGIGKELVAGNNLNSIAYPIIVRQLKQTLQTDDTIDSFSVDDIVRTDDSVSIELSIYCRSGDIINLYRNIT